MNFEHFSTLGLGVVLLVVLMAVAFLLRRRSKSKQVIVIEEFLPGLWRIDGEAVGGVDDEGRDGNAWHRWQGDD